MIMYVCMTGGPKDPALAPRLSMIYCAYIIHDQQRVSHKAVTEKEKNRMKAAHPERLVKQTD
jgi:hypothetical protein